MSFADYISPETQTLQLDGIFQLEGGESLQDVHVAYRSWGELSPLGDNAVLVCHALTGSADVDDWWSGLLGAGQSLDPERDFIVASNVLGGCYGTTGPLSPALGRGGAPFGPDFPGVTIRDHVRIQALLLKALGVRRLRVVIGGSMGGMQALEWAVSEPLPVDAAVAIGAPARHSAWAVGLGEIQRRAIQTDPHWNGGHYDPASPPLGGLAVARMVAMSSYRSPGSFDLRFGREKHAEGHFQVEGYLRYQGDKLGSRFDANAYRTITLAMDSHDLARGRGSLEEVLSGIRPPVLCVGIPSDVLYLPGEVETLAAGIPGGELAWIESPHGHDAFLIEQDQVNELVGGFRNRSVEGRVGRCA